MSDGLNVAALERSLNSIARAVNEGFDVMDTQINAVSTQVGKVSTDLDTTKKQVHDLRAKFDEYVEQAERTANVQRAETKLHGLKAEIDREFGHHNVVRRTSIGTLQAFDVGNVSNTVVSQISEELMIQTPRYWLAPALVALAAWSRDDLDTARISIEEATRRDPRKTALFFALVLRRQGRGEAAMRWLRHYLQGLDPMRLNREFVVVFECVNVGAFGPAGVEFAAERISGWNEKLLSDPEVVEQQISTWQAFIGTQQQRIAPDEFPTLRRVCPTWPALEEVLESASAIPVALQWFETVRDRTETRTTAAEDVLDDILEALVTEYDEDELPRRREILYNESILEANGDLDRAKQRAQALEASLDEEVDMVALQTGAATQPEVWGVGASTQRASIGAEAAEALSGVGRYTMDYRAKVPSEAEIHLDGNHTGFAGTYGFQSWTTRTSIDEQSAVDSLGQAWEATFHAARERLAFKPQSMIVPIVIATVIALIGFLIPPHHVTGLIPLLVGGGIVAYLWWSRQTTAEQALRQLESSKQEALAESVRILRAARAEYFDAGQLYAELDTQESELLDIINAWPVGHAGTTAKAS